MLILRTNFAYPKNFCYLCGMKNKIILFIVTAIMSSTITAQTFEKTEASTKVEIVTEGELTYYYFPFSRVNLAVGEMPATADSSVLFVAAAAFTGQLLEDFSHSNIAGNHVVDGVFYNGYPCDVNTGTFTYYDGTWQFHYKAYADAMRVAANGSDGAAFGQCLLMHNGALVEDIPLRAKFTPERKGLIYYRSLCEKNGRLCIVESATETTFAEYLNSLAQSGITHAIYMDGNSGWNYSWYRDNAGEVVVLHPETARSRFCTNWIVFYR